MRVHAILCVVATALMNTAVSAQERLERPLPESRPFLANVRTHLQRDEQLQHGYAYVETRRELKLDKQGRSTKEKVTVVESYPGLPGEERWQRVVAENGIPVAADELAKKDRERTRKAQEYVRRLQRDPEKVKRVEAREREKEHRETAEVVDEIFRVYDIQMLGREPIEEHQTIVFSLTPRPGVKPRTRDGKIMRNFTAKAWVSESDYELVRVDIQAIDTVSFGLGLLARVHKGARASFTRRKVNNEVWLPARASYTASARIGLVKVMRVGGTSEFSDYRKFTVDTSTTYSTKP